MRTDAVRNRSVNICVFYFVWPQILRPPCTIYYEKFFNSSHINCSKYSYLIVTKLLNAYVFVIRPIFISDQFFTIHLCCTITKSLIPN